MFERRSRLSRRHFVGGTIATVLAGCTGAQNATTTSSTERADVTQSSDSTTNSTTRGTTEDTTTEAEEKTTEVELAGLNSWVPKPALMNERDYYLISDVVFWNFERIRPFKDSLHPEFYGRITEVPHADQIGLSPSDVDARIDVASQSARVYLGQFDTETITSTLTQNGLTKNQDIGSFELFIPGETGYQHVVGVGEDAVVVGEGVSIEMANDDRSSQIAPKTAAVQVIDAHRTKRGTYADASESFRSLTETAKSFDIGTVRTFERVSTPTPEQLKFTGCVGIADGSRFSRPKSEYVITFLFSKSNEAVVEPIRKQFQQKSGFDEYDDVSYSTDGSAVTVRARMENERFDNYLPGDPEDRD